MIRKSSRTVEKFLLGICLVVIFALCFSGPAFSVVKFDGSAVARGRTDTLSGPTYTIEAGMGTQKGSNLFHSFRYSISGQVRRPYSQTPVQQALFGNVISRVTGGSPSSIDGGIASVNSRGQPISA